jgi:hypothetical protein
MDTKIYKYGLLTVISRFVFNIFSVLYFFVGLIGFVLIPAFSLINQNHDQVSLLFVLGGFIGWSIWSPFIFIFLATLLSDITITNDGIGAKILWHQCDTEWSSIVDVRVRTGIFKRRTILILTKNGLTPFHRIYGILYGRRNLPALMIFPSIKDFDLLKKEVLAQRKKNKTSI